MLQPAMSHEPYNSLLSLLSAHSLVHAFCVISSPGVLVRTGVNHLCAVSPAFTLTYASLGGSVQSHFGLQPC